ncbi:hypothetical protein CLV94_2693 [Flavobacterium endophyticum]|uniref:Uncharacterized protein n=1 Tax=Flavobacterium endophyticum TaxID=1540163 RepID=A0A495M2N2_9FLAO|nr:hypothetical protein CLV94_2693 [Flavobacterium endophyticum]
MLSIRSDSIISCAIIETIKKRLTIYVSLLFLLDVSAITYDIIFLLVAVTCTAIVTIAAACYKCP